MNSDIAIRVEGLGKSYLLYHKNQPQLWGRYKKFSDELLSLAKKPAKLVGKWFNPDSVQPHPAQEVFWALKDVSFEVKKGEVIGVIGRNGAGKSTLLKILSRITEPTRGEVIIDGRVSSLLEVGTGFHPELTARENIFLNGAILGMSRSEIKKKFDEIIAFAEVEKFLDTPVKHFSSGMYVRLAFAVAAHLEPEILIVDEVLAVGDQQFQQKCLGKMDEVSRLKGRTVIFVSHNLTAVQTLCEKAIYLKSGRVQEIGPVEQEIALYLKDTQTSDENEQKGPVKIGPNIVLHDLKFNPNPVVSGLVTQLILHFTTNATVRLNEMALLIYSNLGARVAILDLRPFGLQNLSLDPAKPFVFSGKIKSLPLVEGDYQVGIYLNSDTHTENFMDLACLQVISSTNLVYVPYPAAYRGFVELEFAVDTNQEDQSKVPSFIN